MPLDNANAVLSILRRVDIPAHEIKRGDLIANCGGILVAQVIIEDPFHPYH